MGTGVLSTGLERTGRAVEHLPPSSEEVKHEWNYTSTPPLRIHGVDRENCTFTLSWLRRILVRVPNSVLPGKHKLPRYELSVRLCEAFNSSASCRWPWRLWCGEVNVATSRFLRNGIWWYSRQGSLLVRIQSPSVPVCFRSSNQGRLVKNEERINMLQKQFAFHKTKHDLEKRRFGIMENPN